MKGKRKRKKTNRKRRGKRKEIQIKSNITQRTVTPGTGCLQKMVLREVINNSDGPGILCSNSLYGKSFPLSSNLNTGLMGTKYGRRTGLFFPP